MGEHIGADHLKAFHGHALLFLLRLGRLALQLRLDGFLHLAQLPGNPLDTIVVRKPGDPFPAIRQMLVLQIRLQFTLRKAHGNAADPVILICLISRPGTVDGNETGQRAVIDHRHGKVSAGMPEAMTVQDTLGGIPLSSGDNRVMMSGLVVLVLLPVIPLRLMIMEIRRPRFAG